MRIEVNVLADKNKSSIPGDELEKLLNILRHHELPIVSVTIMDKVEV